MVLSDNAITKLGDSFLIEPFKPANVEPASYDITLDNEFLTVDTFHNVSQRNKNQTICEKLIDSKEEVIYKKHVQDYWIIEPKSFVLATTKERVYIPDILKAKVEGRSSIGRMGIFIQNAGHIDPGFSGQITLELFNANKLPVKIYAGQRIGQLVFSKLDQTAANPYEGKYKNQNGVTGSNSYKDREFD